MATYITLGRYTSQGITNIKEVNRRLQHNKDTIRSVGGELKAFYLTMGQYDWVAVTEAPDDATAARIALAVSSRGNVTTETMRAFTESETTSLVESLP